MVDNEIGNPLNPPVSFRIQHCMTSCYAYALAYNTERATSLYSYQGVFTDHFGVNLDYLLGLPNQPAKRKCLRMAFLTFK